VHALESLNSNNSSLPSNFKQKDNLEKQVSVIDAHIVTYLFGSIVEALALFFFTACIYYSSFA